MQAYSQAPCDGGRAIAAEPAPSADQRRAALDAAQRDAKAADALEKERVQQEAHAAPAYIPAPRTEAAFEPHKSPEKAATRKLDVFTASAPVTKVARESAGKKPAKKKATDKAGPASKAEAEKGKPPGGVLAVSR